MVQKRSGRPRSFDPEMAVMQAVEVFWAKGYEGASLDDLTKAIGINRPSLYATFGDKRRLFLAAIQAYGQKISGTAVDAFEAAPTLRDAVRTFFQTALENATRPGKPQGCLIGSAAVASANDVEGVGDLIRQMSLRSRARLQARFDQAIADADLPPDFPSERRAALMIELMQGQVHRARIGDSRDAIADGLEDRVSAVLAVQSPNTQNSPS
ncbi:MAG: TetR/AcrR family transcriptional regulator [Pseudomonadota bacterium]